MRRTNLHRALYHDAMALRAQRALGRLGAMDYFSVRVVGERWPIVVSVLTRREGNSRTEPEVLAMCGPLALEQAMVIAGADGADGVEAISCSFCQDSGVPSAALQFLHRAGVPRQKSTVVPTPLKRSKGQDWRALSDSESRTLFMVLRGMLLAFEQGWLTAKNIRRPEGLLTLTLTGDPLDPELSVGWGEGTGGSKTVSVDLPPIMLIGSEQLEDLPKVSQTWLVGCPVAPLALDESDSVVRVVLVVDRRSRRLIDGHTVTGRRWPYAAASHLFEVMIAKGHIDRDAVLPEQILCTEREIVRLLCPELKLMDVTCRYEPTAEGPLATAYESFLQRLIHRPDMKKG